MGPFSSTAARAVSVSVNENNSCRSFANVLRSAGRYEILVR